MLTSLLLLSLPQPDTAAPAPTPNTAIPNTAATADARRENLLDCSAMVTLLLPESMDADSLPDGL